MSARQQVCSRVRALCGVIREDLQELGTDGGPAELMEAKRQLMLLTAAVNQLERSAPVASAVPRWNATNFPGLALLNGQRWQRTRADLEKLKREEDA